MKANPLDDEADGRLIRRFAEGRDERAFARLVQRHGALVAGVCARRLQNGADADDAFQAVFLVLARKAHALRRRSSIAGWLHEVAVRVCKNERRAGRRRQRQLQEIAQRTREPARRDRLQELKRVIDEELAALPQREREVLILCDLEGRTQAEVASRLSVPVGTVSSRLGRGRAAMRKRLARQGITIAAGGVSFALVKCAEAAPTVSPELVQTTVHNAQIFVAGTDAMKSTLGTKASTLANGALHAMLVTQWKTAACLVALLATSLFGGAVAPRMIQTATAETVFYDDFDDTLASDGNPATWLPFAPWNNGTFDATSGDYVLSPFDSSGDSWLVSALPLDIDLSNVSLRTQIRSSGPIDINNDGIALLARADPARLFAYQGGIAPGGLAFIGFNHPTGFSNLATVMTDLRPVEEDVVMQFDVIGDSLSLYVWRAHEPKPQSPQLHVTSTLASSGNVAIAYDPPPGATSATYRYVHVAEAPIPDYHAGDCNFDGRVDLEDLNAVRNHFGEGELGGPRVAGDAYPFDGVVDLGDLNLVRNHFGAGTEGVAAPEPATASLTGSGVGALLFALFVGQRRYRLLH